MMHRLNSVQALALFLLVFLGAVAPSFATDLTIDPIYSPRDSEVVGSPAKVIFRVRNINILRADQYSVTVLIHKAGVTSPVYTKQVEGANLLAHTDTTITLIDWLPLAAGDYTVTATVAFSEDINLSNNTRTKSVKVVERPPVTVAVQQVVHFEPRRDSTMQWGYVTISVPPTQTVKFINVLVRRTASDTGVWMVRNVMVLPSDRLENVPLNSWFNFKRLGFLPGKLVDSLNVCIYCTETPMTEAPKPDVLCEWIIVKPDYYTVGGAGAFDSLARSAPQIVDHVDLPTFTPTTPVVTDSIERGCSMPNIDLDSTQHNSTNTPGYAGDKNACGPAAAANSLHWMELADPRITTGLSHRQKLEELSALMQRANEGGVMRENFIKAKLAFIDKYKLPIRVKFMSWMLPPNDIVSPNPDYGHKAVNLNPEAVAKARQPKWDWLVGEIKDSEDVEMELGYYDSTGRNGGHWVTVTGTHTVMGVHRLRFKDDGRQRIAEGPRMDVFTWDTTSEGWNRLNEWSYGSTTVFIESLVSESYDPTMTFPQSGVEEPTPKPFGLRVLNMDGRLVSIELKEARANTILKLVDVRANVVATIALQAGQTQAFWDGRQSNGARAASGVYFIIAESGDYVETAKVVLE